MIGRVGFDRVFTVGEEEEFRPLLEGSGIPWRHLSQPEDAVSPVHEWLSPADLLVVKGDINERMFVVTERLREMAATPDDSR